MNNPSTCTNMIKQQLRTGDVLDENILALYKEIPRDLFVPAPFKPFAYSDMQIALAHQQRMMTPLEEATVLQALALTGHETVLEIGTGSGFLTALLSRLCKKVISVDYYNDFTAAARDKLAQCMCSNVELVNGDGVDGWLDKAPYDVIVFSSALLSLKETHRLQVNPGGKLFAILGKAPVMQAQLHTLNHHDEWQMEILFETNLPSLINSLKPDGFVF